MTRCVMTRCVIMLILPLFVFPAVVAAETIGPLYCAYCGPAGGEAGAVTIAGVATDRVDSTACDQEPSLKQMAGQMIMVGFRGFELRDDMTVVGDVKERNIGGVVLFDYDVPKDVAERNIRSPQQVASLNEQLQQLTETPLLIAVDQEGGQVSRLKEEYGFFETKSHQYLGDRSDPEQTRRQAERIASLLRELGFNLNFAPVVDLNANPENPIIGRLQRSFSQDPEIVTSHAEAFINAHRREGVLTALKHFPGHGSSEEDSHLGLVDVTGLWQREELIPYRNLIENDRADGVMTAHVFNADLDDRFPATLSENVIGELLRGELGYRNVVYSDDMQMQAIRDHYTLDEAIKRTILAGVDMLVFANNSVYEEDIAQRALESIVELVERGAVPEDRIRSSYERIMEVKRRLER